MSFSKPNTRKLNPAELFIEYKGGDGVFQYWDKKAPGKQKGTLGANIVIPLEEMKFVVLDKDLMSVTGYSEKYNAGIYSNEVRSINDHLTVKVHDKAKTTLAAGPYTKIKEAVKGIGGRFTRCIYIMWKERLCHLKLSGIAFSAWAEDVESHGDMKLTQYWVSVTGTEKGKKGKTEFYKPKFEFKVKIGDKSRAKATELDKEVQDYLETYLEKGSPNDEHTTDIDQRNDTDAINTDEWSKFKVPGTTTQVGMLAQDKLIEYKDTMEERGEVDGAFYQHVCRAIFEHQKAAKSWRSQKTKDGKKLSDYSLAELSELSQIIARKNPHHQLAPYVNAALNELGNNQSVDTEEDDDEIPF